MKIGLIDVDSKIPNLALMKISAWHKEKGDQVEFYRPLFDNPDKCYVSKIYDFTEDYKYFPNCEILKGGSAYDLIIKLPQEIEHIYPDYFLYRYSYAMGYTSRGCNRKCPFCIVPQKEGKWISVSDIHEFWNGQNKIMLLDNSLNADEDHFKNILNQLIKEKIRVDFSQGLDIRLLTNEQAYLLSKVRLWKQIHFAWDWMEIEDQVKEGIKILDKYKLKRKSMFYVLVGYNTKIEEDIYRIEMLRNLRVDPYVMVFNKRDQPRIIKELASWANNYQCGQFVTFDKWLKIRKVKEE